MSSGAAITSASDAEEARLQYAALPYRFRDGVEILLVSSRETRRWVLPKGWPMKSKKPHSAAAREAMEEAGLVGKIDKKSLGSYHYQKRLKNGATVLCRVQVFPMLVEKQRKSWPEQNQRTTQWFSIPDAAEAVAEPELRDVILEFESVAALSRKVGDAPKKKPKKT
jgi:8-oxo-dGTP pyrophosphatase MutT (NUDIX family)